MGGQAGPLHVVSQLAGRGDDYSGRPIRGSPRPLDLPSAEVLPLCGAEAGAEARPGLMGELGRAELKGAGSWELAY